MPTSPNNRAGGGEPRTPGEASSAVPDSSAEKVAGQSRSSRRLKRQNLMQRFSKLREDAQLAGLIQTTPAEAVKDERVKKEDQTEQPQPKLVEKAIRSGWAVPDEIKPELVKELVDIVTDDSEEASDKTKVAAFRALLAADQSQHERDNPQTKKGGTAVNVSVQTNIAAVDVLREAMKKVEVTQQPPQTPQITEE